MPRRVAAVIALVFTAWVTIPWAIIGTFVAGVVPGGWRTLAVFLMLVFAAFGLRVAGFMRRGFGGAAIRRGVFVPLYYTFFFLPLVAVAALAGALLGWPFSAALADGRTAIVGALILLGVLAFAGWLGSRHLVVRRIEERHPRIPPGLDGVRIVQLSDLHVGAQSSRRFLRRIVATTEREHPDLLVFTGDQVDDFAGDAEEFGRIFGRIPAPLGAFAIAGNHDVYAGWDAVAAGIRRAGIRVLVNEGAVVRRNGSAFWIGGIGDPAAQQRSPAGHRTNAAPDADRTMATAPSDAFRLVLAHNPALWPSLRSRGADLTLSGHTHQGQLAIPSLRWSLASPFVKFAMGRYADGDSVLYVSAGTNYWGIPLRLGAWPEVTVITLRHAAQEDHHTEARS